MSADRVLWVTGAGSGIGRAAAVAAAAAGSRVALSGRRLAPLAQTDWLVTDAGGQPLTLPLDARDPEAVRRAYQQIVAGWGEVSDLVLAAGTNTPQRYWRNQSVSDFERILATNLTAVVSLIDVVLPGMRACGGGRIVVVSSYSAWKFSPHAGVAYTASKAALAEICASLNAQEAASGIRACHLCPGDVDTDLLEQRPQAPDADARKVMLSANDVARAVLFVLDSPPHVRIDELVISPVAQA
ncbi:MAG TPA: SDR family NAD(P)-dependent oxidoreductase [Propionibacteriaceae bacterium]|nr:SDR family NAD(P)-dependent oxidoreductase [Propionibacteriaceae bacterium]